MRLSRKALRRIGFTLLGLMVVLVILAAASWAERIRNADEEYAVYSAYLSDGLLNDAHDWGARGRVLLSEKHNER